MTAFECQQNAFVWYERRWRVDSRRPGSPEHDRTGTGRQASRPWTRRAAALEAQCSWRLEPPLTRLQLQFTSSSSSSSSVYSFINMLHQILQWTIWRTGHAGGSVRALTATPRIDTMHIKRENVTISMQRYTMHKQLLILRPVFSNWHRLSTNQSINRFIEKW